MHERNNHHQSRLRQTRYLPMLVSQVVIKTNKSDKTQIKKILKLFSTNSLKSHQVCA